MIPRHQTALARARPSAYPRIGAAVKLDTAPPRGMKDVLPEMEPWTGVATILATTSAMGSGASRRRARKPETRGAAAAGRTRS